MESKVCTKCGEEKPLSGYNANGRGGKRPDCKECAWPRTPLGQKWHRAYREKNKDSIADYFSEYRKNNKGKFREYSQKYWRNNKDKAIKYSQANKGANRERRARYMSEYRRANKEKIAQYQRERRRKDPQYKIAGNLRGRVNKALKGGTKAARTMELVGCTIEELIQHLESQFTDGMTWEKYMNGKIHTDHIKPCAAFDLTDPEQQKQCFGFKNLQPLWAEENLQKNDKWFAV